MVDTRNYVDIAIVKIWLSVIAMSMLAVENFYDFVFPSSIHISYLSLFVTFLVVAVGAYQDGDNDVSIASMIGVLIIAALAVLDNKGAENYASWFNRLSFGCMGVCSFLVAGLYVRKLGGGGSVD